MNDYAGARGLTLLELMVIVGIISILFYMTIPLLKPVKPNLSKNLIRLEVDPFCNTAFLGIRFDYPLPGNVFVSDAKRATQSALCWPNSRVAVCYTMSQYEIGACKALARSAISECESPHLKALEKERMERVSPTEQKAEVAELLSCVGAKYIQRYKRQLISKNRTCQNIESFLETGKPEVRMAACIPGIPWDEATK